MVLNRWNAGSGIVIQMTNWLYIQHLKNIVRFSCGFGIFNFKWCGHKSSHPNWSVEIPHYISLRHKEAVERNDARFQRKINHVQHDLYVRATNNSSDRRRRRTRKRRKEKSINRVNNKLTPISLNKHEQSMEIIRHANESNGRKCK